ncbi:uncharacterized protein [Tursiops truncatus]|uniref:uncharacterized protein isoform X1 n=1 Tax=Tursiops truncatus TaxID=9739 RepID=UPI003CCFC9D1
MAAFSLNNKVRWTHHGPAAALSPRREALTIVQPEDEKVKEWSVNPRNSLESFKSRSVTLTLTLGGLWEPTPFLPPLSGWSFPGSRTLPTGALHPRPGSCRGAAVPRLTSGAKVGGPPCFRTSSRRPEPTRASGKTPPRQKARDSGSEPATSRAPPLAPRGLTCRSPETRAPPRPPRVLEVRVPGPTQQWRSRKLAPRLPQAGSRQGPACGRVGRAAASAFLLPAWRLVGSWGYEPTVSGAL